ncbi:hypothetical protein PNEG_02559 [Pneumocystis murina B123]|uniref:Uncharacterized protein n=1 Tax=Pneumocystis murina (strain B123) TaxID=1069680 RepID=M7NKQ3_PNEMU|nr:hypothetical protein PNEG_02559 [Pneumocystis murina B123]EMR09223.1 hypothetical protein PNEG_02559 [Pneumocystis murina B123]
MSKYNIQYVLPLDESKKGHRLGLNAVTIDPLKDGGRLYTAGRDGIIFSWNLNLHFRNKRDFREYKYKNEAYGEESSDILESEDIMNNFNTHIIRKKEHTTHILDESRTNNTGIDVCVFKDKGPSYHSEVQAHMHWINDLALVDLSRFIVSCSSDHTIKMWKTDNFELEALTIGKHEDYVKCLATPKNCSTWIASGGLDRKIIIWDLHSQNKVLDIDTSIDGPKGGVYALGAKQELITSGCPSGVVHVWDKRSGQSIASFTGHKDAIRTILISDDGQTILSGSSDTTIKAWSLGERRCLLTFTIHGSSVWSLFSQDPRLNTFYSGDRSGYLMRTRTMLLSEEENVSYIICREQSGINRIVTVDSLIWTSTSSPNIHCWLDAPLDFTAQKSFNTSKLQNIPTFSEKAFVEPSLVAESLISPYDTNMFESNYTENSISNECHFFSSCCVYNENPLECKKNIIPLRKLPQYTIQSQIGLVKHILLNDRRHVLTVDTQDEVSLWNIITCTHVKNYGKCDINELEKKLNTLDYVANWCHVDTRIGALTVSLNENSCFDAEVYADQIDICKDCEYNEDHKINLGKWVLRCLFNNFIEVQIKNDNQYRHSILDISLDDLKADKTLLPLYNFPDLFQNGSQSIPDLLETSKKISSDENISIIDSILTRSSKEASSIHDNGNIEKKSSSLDILNKENNLFNKQDSQTKMTKLEESLFASIDPNDHSTNSFTFIDRLKFFRTKKVLKTIPKDSKAQGDLQNIEKKDTLSTDLKNFQSLLNPEIQKTNVLHTHHFVSDIINSLRNDYRLSRLSHPDILIATKIYPICSDEAPILQLPHNTILIISKEKSITDNTINVYKGKIGCIIQHVDILENVLPAWLGNMLLFNKIPNEEIQKINFILQPYQNCHLPKIYDENKECTASGMLRVRKILIYILKHLNKMELLDTNPENYLQLICNKEILSIKTTLITIKTRIWKSKGSIILHYRPLNKEIYETYFK